MGTSNYVLKLQTEIEKSNHTVKNMQQIFYNSAHEIMNDYKLMLNNIEFELTEIEFYYFDCNKHCDIYVHQNELQKETNGFLYAHENSWGNYGGIDFTFGNGHYFGGILIRGIKINNTFFAGPAKVRNLIVEKIDDNINSYIEFQDYLIKNKNNIFLQEKEKTEGSRILHSRRFNLGKQENKEFRNALYRFAREDYLKAKQEKSFTTSSNIKEISMLKAISSLTINYECNEPSTIKKIKANSMLYQYINDFCRIT